METKEQYSRAQLRAAERIKEEADQLHRSLCGKFIQFFNNSDEPLGVDVHNKIKELSAKWKTYCHTKKIKVEFHDSIKDWCEKYLEDFKAEKEK